MKISFSECVIALILIWGALLVAKAAPTEFPGPGVGGVFPNFLHNWAATSGPLYFADFGLR